MPEQPPGKHSRGFSLADGKIPRPRVGRNSPRYAELRARTNYSFLRGASHPDELVGTAAALGYEALAIVDRNSLAGVVRAHAAAKEIAAASGGENGLKLLIGAEVTPLDAPPVVLLATDRAAYGRLASLLTLGKRRAEKGDCRLFFDDLAGYAQGLIACVPLAGPPGGNPRPAETQSPSGDRRICPAALGRYRDVFGDCCYALAELHLGPDDHGALARMRDLAREANLPLAAANDVHYHVPDRRFLQDVLVAIREGKPVSELGDARFPNGECYLKSSAAMAALFADCPEAIERTIEIAGRCNFSLDELRYDYPVELAPPGMAPIEYLRRLTWEGAARRYPQGVPEKVRRTIEHELALIKELRYEAYFLTVWDLVRFARGRGILCQGRGSAANSAVCYCLEVTSVDPDRIDVLFERFVSRERNEAPDIDVDFEHERREEVIQYMYEKYGRDRAGMTAEVITYRPRSAVRDVGKALGLSPDRIDLLAKSLDHYSDGGDIPARFREAGIDPTSRLGRQLIVLVRQILGFPRHLSQHVGGMVITNSRLCELVPIENAAMPFRTVIEWDKDDLDALGILKVDCLALGMLTAIRKCFDLIETTAGGERPPGSRPPVPCESSRLTLATIPAEDPSTYEMIQRADTMGVFQIESRAQMAMLPRLKPARFYDLVIEVAIVRPGPIQGDMVHPYLRRRAGQEPVEYPDERIREVLGKTLGVPIFQEQAMRLAVVAAGFTPGEADQLRRAMGAWRKRGVLQVFEKKLIDGMQANGYPAEFARRVFQQISGFGEYGFPESHAASFALLVYVSAWLKRHYPAAFAAALLNSQPMGFYAPAQLVADARKHGVEIRPVDVNASAWDCTLERREGRGRGTEIGEQVAGASPASDCFHSDQWSLQLGLRLVRGLSRKHAERTVQEREAGGPFRSFADFARRTGLPNSALATLAGSDAFASLRMNRRAALWESLPEQKRLPLFDGLEPDEQPVELPEMSPFEEVVGDYRAVGLSLREHPLSFVRPLLEKSRVVRAKDLATLPVDRRYKVGGLVLLRQRPSTAKGITFVTLEDETGLANLIIRQEVWERYRRVARRAQAMIVHGRLQRQDGVIHIQAEKLEDLSKHLAAIDARSRDFR